MEISAGKNLKSRREKIRRSDFAPPEKFSCYAADSHAWKLLLTHSRQACKISHMNAKHLAEYVKSLASRKS